MSCRRGWVRDKLLNKTNSDIDIALSNIKGSELARCLNNELYPNQDKVGIIVANKEKGKHLETATIRINDMWIDFVNLRSSNDDVIGTPLEDAERRDITINSLFYNIHTNQIEDWTSKGITDLKEGIIDTPITPWQTFSDDPLRIMRMIRFAWRYQFKISNDIEECIQKHNDEFVASYMNVISVERIYKELTLMIEGNFPWSAMYLLYRYNLWPGILKVPATFADSFCGNNEIKVTINVILITAYWINHISRLSDKSDTANEMLKLIEYNSNSEYRRSWYLLLLTVTYRNYLIKSGKEMQSWSKVIIKDNWKCCNENIRDNSVMVSNIDDWIKAINSSSGFSRWTSGRVWRRIKYVNIGKMFIAGIVMEYINALQCYEIINHVNEEILKDIVMKYSKYYEYIDKEGLNHWDEMKPLLDGDGIIKELNIKPGKEIGIWLESWIDKQIEENDWSYENAILFLNQKREEIKGGKEIGNLWNKSNKKQVKK